MVDNRIITNFLKMKIYVFLLLIITFIFGCSKDSEKVLTNDDFYSMTGSYTLSKMVTSSTITNFYYNNSKLYKATDIAAGTTTITGYRNYEFNDDGLIESIYDLSPTNNIIDKYQYIYNSDLLLTLAFTYNNSTGNLVLETIRQPVYDDNGQLIKLNYMNASSQLQSYELFYYNDNGDFRKTETYDKNDNLISYYECEWDSNPNVYSKMYRLPWMEIHNKTQFSSGGLTYIFNNLYDGNYLFKTTQTYNGSFVDMVDYNYN